MSTRITNLTPGLMTLPAPYRGALGPGRGGVVSDSPATVVANLGGVLQTEGVYRFDLTSEPGQAQFNPSPGSPSFSYTSDGVGGPIRPAASASGGTVASPVWAYSTGPGGLGPNVPIYSDGVEWYDVAGNIT